MTSRPTPPGGWPIEQAITALNTDTLELRKLVLRYHQAETSDSGNAAADAADVARFDLWPALIAKVRGGHVTARGRRTAAAAFETIDPEMLERSEPDFKAGSFRQSDVEFHAVRFFPVVATPKQQSPKRGRKPTESQRVEREVLRDVAQGLDLATFKQESLADRYRSTRSTVVPIVRRVLSEIKKPTNADN